MALRCAFIHPFLFRYARGIERYTFSLANALADAGAEVHLVTWRWAQSVQVTALDPHVHIHLMPTIRYYTASTVIPFYSWHLWRQRYDFVWIYFAGYGEAETMRLCQSQRFGIVLHYPFSQVPHRYVEFRRFNTARRASKVVAVSRLVAEEALAPIGRCCEVIHHGVDADHFRPEPGARVELRRRLAVGPDAPLLLTMAALEERKGIQWVIRALPAVIRVHPETNYLVLGDGPFRGELERLAVQIGVQQHVRFLGVQEDVLPWLKGADISLILARGEASSLTALESLAVGVPVIASQRRPFDELITNDCGSLVPEEDMAQVSNAILHLLGNTGARRRLSSKARQHILTHFSWERTAHDYLTVMS